MDNGWGNLRAVLVDGAALQKLPFFLALGALAVLVGGVFAAGAFARQEADGCRGDG
ncbi:MAG: hypothetical protein R6X32_17360 [Chloroflexota bacterium]